MRTRRGFTLVELVASIGLMLLLAAGIPTLFRREGDAGTALRMAQRELVTALELARHTAQARQVAVRLRVPGAPDLPDTVRRWWLEHAEDGQWLALRETGELPPGTQVVAEEGAAPYVEFRLDGSLVGGARRIMVASAGSRATVRVVLIMADGRIEEGAP